MIAWTSDWWASKLCIRPCRNRSWWLPLRALRHRMWNSPNMLTIWCVLRPTANRHHRRHGRQDMSVVVSTRRQGRSSSRSPEYFDTGEQQAEREREVTMTQPAAYARYSQRVWTNANLAKDFVKVTRPTLIWSSWNRMRTTSLVNLLVGCCMRRTLTNRHIQLWTKLEQSNRWICS